MINPAWMDTLRHGGIAILPTETVYGLAGRADMKETIDRIYYLKGRDFDKPMALCVDSIGMADQYGVMSGLAGELAQAFWPGPLSLIVKSRNQKLDSRLYAQDSQGRRTISMRCPQASWLSSIGRLPLALTSANPSGKPAPLNREDAADYIGEGVDVIFDGTPCPIGISSTILSVNGRNATILRQGSITPEDLVGFDIGGDDW